MAEPSVAFRNLVCEVTLCEPEKHNPLSPEVLTCLEQVVRNLQEDHSTRVLLLRGKGVSFSSGADLRSKIARAHAADLEAHPLQLTAELLSAPEAPLAITKDALAAIGRDRMGFTGWADPDLSMWSRQEEESVSARQKYVDALAARSR